MPTLVLRYEVRPDAVDDVVAAVEGAFAAVKAEQTAGIRWTYWRGPGEHEFGAILEFADGAENPLPGVAAARAVQEAVARGAVGDPPQPQPITVLGTYSSANVSVDG